MLSAQRRLRQAGRMLCAAGEHLRAQHQLDGSLDSLEARSLIDQVKAIVQQVEEEMPPLPTVRARGMEVRELAPR